MIVVMITGIFLVLSAVPMVSAMEKVNINKASAKQLMTLKNVGPKTAQAIIVYRKAHNGFKTPKEITKIKGVGEKTFQANKDIIVIKDK